tara:strand:- start:364 stop:678 length:315 start_codon:yes stop_codon:yes gene_type:complete
MKYHVITLSIAALLFPLTSHAAKFNTIGDIIGELTDIVALATPVVAGLALLVLFWGAVKLILHADNEEKRRESKQILIWGTIALFVLISIWGIVTVLQNTFLRL